MAVTTYYSVGSEIIGERTGATRRDYLRDALGSVTATKVTSESTLQNTYRYNPYGSRLSKTGIADDPRFQWNGTSGYRDIPSCFACSYVRDRHYSNSEANWTTIDRQWPSESAYGYAWASPTSFSDPTGLAPCALCLPTVFLKKLDQVCDIKPDLFRGVYKVKIYKCMQVGCMVDGGPGDDCSFTQIAETTILSKGKTILHDIIEDDITFPVPCPGMEYENDGPGLSLPRPASTGRHGACKLQPHRDLPIADVWKLAPLVYKFMFTDKCVCGQRHDVKSWTFGFELKYGKKGLECKFITV